MRYNTLHRSTCTLCSQHLHADLRIAAQQSAAARGLRLLLVADKAYSLALVSQRDQACASHCDKAAAGADG
jgi:hypothetical protein